MAAAERENDMKPHEETWEIDEGDAYCAELDHVAGVTVSGSPSEHVVVTDSGVYGPTRARAKLLAQAPAMARLLLKVVSARYDGRTTFDLTDAEDVLRSAGIDPEKER